MWFYLQSSKKDTRNEHQSDTMHEKTLQMSNGWIKKKQTNLQPWQLAKLKVNNQYLLTFNIN